MYRIFLFTVIVITAYTKIAAQGNVSVSVDYASQETTMDNGAVSITIDGKGQVDMLVFSSKDLINAERGGRFYFSYNDQNSYQELSPNMVSIAQKNNEYAEVVYSNTLGGLRIDQGYIMRKGVIGLYSYVVVKGTSLETSIREMRIVYRVSPTLFTYGYVNEQMQGELPSPEVMDEVNDDAIMDATYPLPDGTIYTKYDWANYIANDTVHGIMSNNLGIWAITPSYEFLNGGPMRQELTVHATNKTPLVLHMLQGEHFGGAAQTFGVGDEKIYGPVFLYVNEGGNHEELIADAKETSVAERAQWPYEWLQHTLYPLERGTLTGRVILPYELPYGDIQVVLAQPGSDIYSQGMEYIYWGKTKSNGRFTIDHVRPGSYTLYAYATRGEVTETYSGNITVNEGINDIGFVEWAPIKQEHLLWEIGENDRTTAGFNMSDEARAYGLYNDPPANLTFTIGSSSPEENWYYAQTKTGTWTVNFDCPEDYAGDALLSASIAGATSSPSVDVYVNNNKKATWSFGNDAAVYRSAVLGGRHELKTLSFPASELHTGQNTIAFKMTSVGSRGGLMYDYLKLEAGEILNPVFGVENQVRGEEMVRAYPNPFAENINFYLGNARGASKYRLAIFNQLGQQVYQSTGNLGPGPYEIQVQTTSLREGIYFYRLETAGNVYSGKLLKKQ